MISEHKKEYMREYRKKTRARIYSLARKWYARNKEKYHAKYIKNREHLIELNAIRNRKMRENPILLEKRKAYNRDRMKKQREGIISPEQKAKILARKMSAEAIRIGKLKRLPCELCGNIKTDAHHPDYSKPLDVRWLCRLHHRNIHRKQ